MSEDKSILISSQVIKRNIGNDYLESLTNNVKKPKYIKQKLKKIKKKKKKSNSVIAKKKKIN